jgi:hypothetical protein
MPQPAWQSAKHEDPDMEPAPASATPTPTTAGDAAHAFLARIARRYDICGALLFDKPRVVN